MLGRLLTVMCVSLVTLAVASCGGTEDQSSAQPDSSEEGEVLFEDDFSDSTSGWRISGAGDAVRAYEDGGYRITPASGQSVTGAHSFAPGEENFGDVSVEVDVSAANGPDDFLFGIACRVQDDQNYYTLDISRSGNYGIRKLKDGQNEKFVNYLQQPSAIQGGEAVNSLRADCVSDTLTLYANGEELVQLRDDEFGSGGVGLSTGPTPSNRLGADVLFDNFVVRRTSSPSASSSEISGAPPPEGEVVNEDDFSDPVSGWEPGSGPSGSGEYANGAFRLSGTPYIRLLANHLGIFTDASVEVDATRLGGPKNSGLGLLCRATSEKDAEYLHYQFSVTSDGTMFIGRARANGPFERLAQARNTGSVDASLGETNRLRADCVGPELTFSIDGERVLEVEDDAIPAAGRVGLEVGGGTRDVPVVAQFDNFVLREP